MKFKHCFAPSGAGATKIVRFMKITTVLLFVGFLQVSAAGYAQRVTLSARGEQLKAVMLEVKQQTGFSFFYNADWLQKAEKVTLELKSTPLDKALDLIFKDQPFDYRIINNTIVLQVKAAGTGIRNNPSLPPAPPDREVTGIVTGEKGEPLEGASVKILGAERGVATDKNGQFKLFVPQGASLQISYLGYSTTTQAVGDKSVFTIVLRRTLTSLEDVVIVGYGTQRKIDLTGAIATVGSEQLQDRPIVNVADGLQGLIPGLVITLNNGQPGTAANFNVRGFSTLSGAGTATPLILVDGVERDPNLIDPNNVESVTVLKDAASATIYGGRAAYGVILITTKTGKKGTPKISYTGSYTSTRATYLPKSISSVQFLQIFDAAQNTGTITGGTTTFPIYNSTDSAMIWAHYKDPAHNPSAYADPTNPTQYRYVGNNNWMKVLYPGAAPMQQHYLSYSGGDDKTTYMASLGYSKQEGLEKVGNQVYQKFNPTLKLNTKANSWLSLDLNISLSHTNNNLPATTLAGQGGAWMPGDLRPMMPVYNPDGHFSGQGNTTNPVAVMTLSGRDINNNNDFWTGAGATITPVKHVSIRSEYAWNYFSNYEKANLLPFNEYGVDGVLIDVFPWTKTSQVDEQRNNNTYYSWNEYATYENTFARKHYVKAMVGYNQEYKHFQYVTATAHNLIDPSIPALGLNNDPKPSVGSTETEYALIGSFYRLNYSYDGRYLLEISGREDGTSRFQQGHRYAFSPAASVGWEIARESFLSDFSNTVSELKLRASYGNLPNQRSSGNGNSPSDLYPTQAIMNPNTSVGYLFNGQTGIAVGAPSLVSSNLTWEKVATKNIGLDYAFLHNTLSGTFDYYITDVSGLITSGQQLPAVLGTSAPSQNTASLRTNGWEFTVSYKNKALNNQLSYGITVNLSDASTVTTQYNQNPTQSINIGYNPGSGALNTGHKLGEMWGYQTVGFYKTDADARAVDNTALNGYTWLAGDVQYADLNKDGKINPGASTLSNHGDLKLLGNSTPRYFFGLNLNAAYKGFDFTMFWQGDLKQDFVPPSNFNSFFPFGGGKYSVPYGGNLSMNYWTPTNTDAYFGRPRFDGGNDQAQSKYLQNAAYARLKQLTFGYTLPARISGRAKLRNLRVYVTGENLFTITSLFKTIDPETITSYSNYPLNKSLSAGLQLNL